MTHKNTPKLFL